MFTEAARNRMTLGIIKFPELRNHAVKEREREKENENCIRIINLLTYNQQLPVISI